MHPSLAIDRLPFFRRGDHAPRCPPPLPSPCSPLILLLSLLLLCATAAAAAAAQTTEDAATSAPAPPPPVLAPPASLRAQTRDSSACPALLKPQQNTRGDHPQLPAPRRADSHGRLPAAARVVGGASAHPDLRRHMAVVVSAGRRRRCSASIIGRAAVLTALACAPPVEARPPSNTTVRLSGWNAAAGLSRGVAATFRNARLSLAVLVLDADIPQTQSRPLRINSQPQIPLPGAAVRVAGYGVAAEGAAPASADRPRQVDVPVVAARECRRAFPNATQIPLDFAKEFCVGYLEKGGCGSCDGDAGGLIVQYDKNNEPVLVGISWRTFGCARRGLPDIHIKAAAAAQWIHNLGVSASFSNDARQVRAVRPGDGKSDGEESGSSPNLAVLVGGIAGGVVLLVVVLALALFCVRRRSSDKSEKGQGKAHGAWGEGAGATDALNFAAHTPLPHASSSTMSKTHSPPSSAPSQPALAGPRGVAGDGTSPRSSQTGGSLSASQSRDVHGRERSVWSGTGHPQSVNAQAPHQRQEHDYHHHHHHHRQSREGAPAPDMAGRPRTPVQQVGGYPGEQEQHGGQVEPTAPPLSPSVGYIGQDGWPRW